MFKGEEGNRLGPPVTLELVPNSKPINRKPYAIPIATLPLIKNEVERLVSIGLLKRVASATWASPCFGIPKKDGTIRFITDFRALNKCLLRKPYPMPTIQELMQSIQKFLYATTIDLNMGYYSIPLKKESKGLCTICLPFGLYEYQFLPMGISVASDIFQELMSSLFLDMENVKVYLDDILIFGSEFKTHLKDINEVLTRLRTKGMQANHEKCEWFAREVEYLGYIISRDGIKPQPKKIQGILNMKAPTCVKHVRQFVGLINFYKEMIPRKSEILTPLTNLCGKKSFSWTAACQRSFEEVKKELVNVTTLTFPDYSLPFEIYTDASDIQMGAAITQNGKPICFFSKKLTPVQQKYPITERELLAIATTLKTYKTMLLGQKLTIYTDHKNLTHEYSTHSCDRVLRQRLLIEEYGAELVYFPGNKNVVADALSRLPTNETVSDTVNNTSENMEEIYLNRKLFNPTLAEDKCPISFQNIKEHQDQHIEQHNDLSILPVKVFGNISLRMYKEKIYIPPSLVKELLTFYHDFFLHPGINRMIATISQHYAWPSMNAQIKTMVMNCEHCQKNKVSTNKHHGLIPLIEQEHFTPFQKIHIDCIGPSKIKYSHDNKIQTTTLKALTIIDRATNWVEFALVENIDSK